MGRISREASNADQSPGGGVALGVEFTPHSPTLWAPGA